MEGLTLENERVDLINDLIAITTIMEDLWRFHPRNPNQQNVTIEYANLKKLKGIIETEIKILK